MTELQQVPATTKQQPPIMVLRERLQTRTDELKVALGEIPVATFIRAVTTSAMINPDILACSWPSVWQSCLRACRDGLLPDGVEAALVPYKSNCTYIPMYRGQIRLFMRSDQFRWIKADLVREGEEFLNWVDETGEHFRHVPRHDFGARIVAVYAAATTKDGAFFCSILSIAEADKIKAMSRNTRDDAPWKSWPEEMYKKTALRRLAKLLPSARDAVQPHVTADEDLETPALGFAPEVDQYQSNLKADLDRDPIEKPKKVTKDDERDSKA